LHHEQRPRQGFESCAPIASHWKLRDLDCVLTAFPPSHLVYVLVGEMVEPYGQWTRRVVGSYFKNLASDTTLTSRRQDCWSERGEGSSGGGTRERELLGQGTASGRL
jgi:hypothetical protein